MNGYLAKIKALNDFDPAASGHRRLHLAGRPCGWVGPETSANLLAASLLRKAGDELFLPEAADRDHTSRSEALNDIALHLVEAGLMKGLRNEPYRVVTAWGEPELARIDRRAVPQLGLRAFGVHVNGYVHTRDGLEMWVGRRNTDREINPGKLDNMVAGGQPAGLTCRENLLKEAEEEAGLSHEMAEHAIATGIITYSQMDGPERVKRDTIFTYDLEVPAIFRPMNQDGEVASFECLALAEVARIVRETDEFKPNCNLVVIDFLIRHGFLSPEDEAYAAVVAGLIQPL